MDFWIIKILMQKTGGRMEKVLNTVLEEQGDFNMPSVRMKMIKSYDEFFDAAENGLLKNSCLLFAVEIPQDGINIESYRILKYLQGCDKDILIGSAGSIIVDGQSDLYTKDIGRRFIFAANSRGCTFPGKPLVEATVSLSNFKVLADLWNMDLREAYVKSCGLLIEKLLNFKFIKYDNPHILVIHASNKGVSNSLKLWEMVEDNLNGKTQIEEISIRNGQVWDCRGCKYEECFHFGEKGDCFYGGVMVEKVYPAIIKCDLLVLICPNYNDSVSANIMAFINRLTSVFRANDFSSKCVYAVVVSGYSGSDIVAQQIIGAINVNKNFILPSRFALIETANSPGEIDGIDGIKERAKDMAERIISYGRGI